ncbi:unnamed protein product [Pseudo-nitzschia multistriata]|uniref:Uncharacterized protein n=1 Tax=Pseudo-nitzschia multistriata TaxID=183589 RepID=A0A448Z5P5_9STRA|nr:unnamed protein product [Pseudo-nitzschia multistriata]
MESLVVELEKKQRRKMRIYSASISLGIVFIFAYIIGSFFNSSSKRIEDVIPEDSVFEDQISTVYKSPKISMPFFHVVQQP